MFLTSLLLAGLAAAAVNPEYVGISTEHVGERPPLVPAECTEICPKYMNEYGSACYALLTGADFGPSLEKTCGDLCALSVPESTTSPEMQCIDCIYAGDSAVYEQWARVNQLSCVGLLGLIDEHGGPTTPTSSATDGTTSPPPVTEQPVEGSDTVNVDEGSDAEEVIQGSDAEEVIQGSDAEEVVEDSVVEEAVEDPNAASASTETASPVPFAPQAGAGTSASTTSGKSSSPPASSAPANSTGSLQPDNGASASFTAPGAVLFAIVAAMAL